MVPRLTNLNIHGSKEYLARRRAKTARDKEKLTPFTMDLKRDRIFRAHQDNELIEGDIARAERRKK
jgi:hypothetical protein